jgi:hypothetical protein
MPRHNCKSPSRNKHAIPQLQTERRKKLVVLKNMHDSINPEDIGIGTQVTNISNIKQYKTRLPLSMFFVNLKPAPNNKDMSNVEYIQQRKIKFEPPEQKGHFSMCKLPKIWAHQKLLSPQTYIRQRRR